MACAQLPRLPGAAEEGAEGRDEAAAGSGKMWVVVVVCVCLSVSRVKVISDIHHWFVSPIIKCSLSHTYHQF